jgi:hypothetical protein
MAAYLGNGLVVTWTSTAGTVTPNTDYVKFDYTPSVEVIDQTAGSDTAVTSLTGVKSGKASMTFNMQAGGTAMTNAFVEGTFGTLTIGPEGTVAGKQKMTFAAYVLGAKYSLGYKDITVVSVDWQQDGARTDSVY